MSSEKEKSSIPVDPIAVQMQAEIRKTFDKKPTVVGRGTGGDKTAVLDVNKPQSRAERRAEAVFTKKVNSKQEELLTRFFTYRDLHLKRVEDRKIRMEIYTARIKQKLVELDDEWCEFLRAACAPEGYYNLKLAFLRRVSDIFTQLARPSDK